MIWMWWLTPPPPEIDPAPTEESVVDTQETARDPQDPSLAEPLPRPEPETLAAIPIAPADTADARTIIVDNELFQATFSTQGATLRSFKLKEYLRFDQTRPVEMVDSTRAGALGIAFTTPANHVADSRAFAFESEFEADTLHVVGDSTLLEFSANVGDGTIRLIYSFYPDEYEIGLRVEMDQASSFLTSDGYELTWHGGIPFSEGDAEEEAQRSGSFVRSGGEVESVELQRTPEETRRFTGDISWVAVKNKYFASIVIPDGQTRGAELDGEVLGEAGTPQPLFEDYTARLLISPTGDVQTFRLYIGPMEYFRLARYRLGLYDMVDYGWNFFEWMTRPLAKYVFIPSFAFLNSFVPNYGLVIIIFAILLKLILYPLTKSSFTSMARMRELQPKMEAIKEQYADNPQKQQEAMMKMYKETGVNPLGGCLPMLMQYPIIIALWQFLPQAIEIRQQGFLWANDLSAPDAILQLPFTIPLYGNFVGGFTLLMGLSMIVQMRIQMQPQTNPQAKIFTYVFPVMIFAIFNRLASGLSLYYLVYNVVTAVQQKWINNRIKTESEEPGGNGRGTKADARSKGKDKGQSQKAKSKTKAPARKGGKKVRN